jgi:hypothetical protein
MRPNRDLEISVTQLKAPFYVSAWLDSLFFSSIWWFQFQPTFLFETVISTTPQMLPGSLRLECSTSIWTLTKTDQPTLPTCLTKSTNETTAFKLLIG